MDTIRLKNMQFYGFHGVDKSEKHLGGRFEVDVEMQLSLTNSCDSDDLNDTVNYERIYKTVNTCVSKDKFYLIEALASSIAVSICKLVTFEIIAKSGFSLIDFFNDLITLHLFFFKKISCFLLVHTIISISE